MMLKKWLFAALYLSLTANALEPSAPVAQKLPKKLTKHGDVRIDNYYWMRNKKDPMLLSHLRAENAYRESIMSDTLDLQERLYIEMRSRIKEEDQSVPYRIDDYLYYNKIKKDEQYPVYCRKRFPDGKEEIMVDVNELSRGLDFIRVSFPAIHFNQSLMAYAVDTRGDRVYTIHFKDLATGKVLNEKIENVTGNFVWAETGRILYYSKHDPTTLRSDKIFRYDLDKKSKKQIFHEKDEKFEVMVYKTQARQHIFIASHSTLSSEVRFAPAKEVNPKFKLIAKREKDFEYHVSDGVSDFYIATNWNARNFRVMKTPVNDPGKNNWREILPHREDVYVEGIDVFKDYLAISERSRGLTHVSVLRKSDLKGDYISFPDPAYTVSANGTYEYDSKEVRYEFESMNRPPSVYDFDIEKKESKLLKEKEVPTYDSSLYVSERTFAKATDGSQIPVSIVYKKGFKKDGSAPLFVYGYGSYGMSSDPYFSSVRVSLLDRGFAFAILHVRGGSEMGRSWYDDGKFFKKKNTFTDFIDATEFLVKEKYGHPQKIFANGGSAGGLLMGAIINMRPDLYRGVLADVPFVDVVTTMLDSSLPLTTGEYEEWGNPNDEKYYEYMKSYSPYDNVSAQDYPHLFVTTGLNDSQVPYWEPTKWVSKIREMRTDKSKMLLMKIEMEVGHGGKTGRYEYLRDEAWGYAFIFKILGIK